MTLGFVGLGVMGGRMAKRLLDGGHRVIGYNRTREKARWLADAGMRVADSPREVAIQADVVFTMVTDTPALDAVCRGPDGILAGLRRGTVHVEMSTVSPEAVRAIAAEVASRGADLLDAPVSGSPVTLEAGQLSFMIGGDPATLERVRPYLAAIGPTLTHVGAVGLAKAMKIAINQGLAVQMVAFSEAVLLERGDRQRAPHRGARDGARALRLRGRVRRARHNERPGTESQDLMADAAQAPAEPRDDLVPQGALIIAA